MVHGLESLRGMNRTLVDPVRPFFQKFIFVPIVLEVAAVAKSDPLKGERGQDLPVRALLLS